MTGKRRITAEKRRLSIIQSAIPLFAENGFRGTTTKEIAESAGVSEALLYQHFPNKESLYNEVQDYCCHLEPQLVAGLESLEPSTPSLVKLINLLAETLISGTTDVHLDSVFPRLMLRSLMDDGAFFRTHLKNNVEPWKDLFIKCFKAAQRSGDIGSTTHQDLAFWFVQHLAVTIRHYHLPETPVVEYGVSIEDLKHEAIIFMLRGLGMTQSAIQTHYLDKNLKELQI